MSQRPSDRLTDTGRVCALLALDPAGLGGVWLRARHGPQRDRLQNALDRLPLPSVRVTRSMDDLALFGGIDLNQSLLTGRATTRPGLLNSPAAFWITGAETMDAAMQSRLANGTPQGSILIVVDEGADDDQTPHQSLLDRCAFYLDETAAPAHDTALPRPTRPPAEVTLSDAQLASLSATATAGGITGLRPLLFAAAAARGLAALDGRDRPDDAHMIHASRLVFGHRATVLPTPEDQPDDTPPPPERAENDGADGADPDTLKLPQELMIEAMQTALPGDVLATLLQRNRAASGAGRGDLRISLQRGRPLPSRPGSLGGRARTDVLATLNAAAPWQKLRGAAPGRIAIRPDDIRVRRYKDQSERLILFVVDASGSAALARLAEGKGAVEHLLARAYSDRDHVAMIVFRDTGADLVLPPTRALVRAKAALAGLAAGGATPLPSGLRLAHEVALAARRKGQTPQVVLISDGRANRTLDGAGDRATATTESAIMARHFRASAIPVTLIDTGRRPSRDLDTLAQTLDTKVVPLPRRLNGLAGEAIASAIDANR